CVASLPALEPKGQPCTANVGGVRSPGSCIPLTLCPPLVALVAKGRRPRPCGYDEYTLLVCCPSRDVVRPPSASAVSPRGGQPAPPRNEPGCGTVVDDAGEITVGPKGEVVLARSPWPWMVAIYEGRTYICGGALLDRDTVLTAAHCFRGLDPEPGEYKVRLGVLATNEAASSRSATLGIKAIRLHKEYRVDRYYKDIAIMKLDGQVTYGSHIGPVCLPHSDLKLGGQVVIIGWGTIVFSGPFARRLQEGRVSVISNKDCDDKLKASTSYKRYTPQGVTNDFVCAENQTGVDACQGDSGGPLLALGADFRWAVAGVVSYGVDCGASFPGAYTRVTTFLPWIEKNRN
ncbi:unnamed protein product, partial [Ixodes hexagonus]